MLSRLTTLRRHFPGLFCPLTFRFSWTADAEETARAQRAVWSKKFIDHIISCRFPEASTDIKNWKSIADQLLQLKVDAWPGGMAELPGPKQELMDSVTVGKGVRLPQHYLQQTRVLNQVDYENYLVFVPTSVTVDLFNILGQGKHSVILLGSSGIGKTFALIYWCLLSSHVVQYRLNHKDRQLFKSLNEAYQLTDVPLNFYYSLGRDQDKHNVQEMCSTILKQVPSCDLREIIRRRCQEQMKNQSKDDTNYQRSKFQSLFSSIKQCSNNHAFDGQRLKLKLAFDQINTYYSWVKQLSLNTAQQRANMNKYDFGRRVSLYTAFLRAAYRDQSSSSLFLNCSGDAQIVLPHNHQPVEYFDVLRQNPHQPMAVIEYKHHESLKNNLSYRIQIQKILWFYLQKEFNDKPQFLKSIQKDFYQVMSNKAMPQTSFTFLAVRNSKNNLPIASLKNGTLNMETFLKNWIELAQGEYLNLLQKKYERRAKTKQIEEHVYFKFYLLLLNVLEVQQPTGSSFSIKRQSIMNILSELKLRQEALIQLGMAEIISLQELKNSQVSEITVYFPVDRFSALILNRLSTSFINIQPQSFLDQLKGGGMGTLVKYYFYKGSTTGYLREIKFLKEDFTQSLTMNLKNHSIFMEVNKNDSSKLWQGMPGLLSLAEKKGSIVAFPKILNEQTNMMENSANTLAFDVIYITYQSGVFTIHPLDWSVEPKMHPVNNKRYELDLFWNIHKDNKAFQNKNVVIAPLVCCLDHLAKKGPVKKRIQPRPESSWVQKTSLITINQLEIIVEDKGQFQKHQGLSEFLLVVTQKLSVSGNGYKVMREEKIIKEGLPLRLQK